MATKQVSLQDVLSALGGPLEERALWALSCQALAALKKSIQEVDGNGGGPTLLITPESMLLSHGGSIQILPGIPRSTSNFSAPELNQPENCRESIDIEKCYIYSLGMSLLAAMRNELEDPKVLRVSEAQYKLFARMTDEECDERPSLEEVFTLCSNFCSNSHAQASEEVDKLVSYVLGSTHECYSDAEEYKIDEADLEAEIQQVINMKGTGSIENLYPPSYGSRASSSLSLGSSSGYQRSFNLTAQKTNSRESFNMYSSLPMVFPPTSQTYDTGKKHGAHNLSDDRLTSLYQHGKTAVSSHLKSATRQVPVEHYGTHFYTPSRRRKPAEKKSKGNNMSDLNKPMQPHLVLFRSSSDGKNNSNSTFTATSEYNSITAMNLEADDMPYLPPKWTIKSASDSDAEISIAPSDQESEPLAVQQQNDLHFQESANSKLDYSNTIVSMLPKSGSNQCDGSFDDFNFPNPPPVPLAEDDFLSDEEKSAEEKCEKVTSAATQEVSDASENKAEESEVVCSISQNPEDVGIKDNSVIVPSNIGSENDTESSTEEKNYSITEIIENHSQDLTKNAQHLPYNNNGISNEEIADKKVEIQGERGLETIPANQYKVVHSTASLKKLSNVLGPEFSTMTGLQIERKDVDRLTENSIPIDRRQIEVVMLNGRRVQFVVEVSSTCRELFNQVIAHQSLEETHIFGLAVIKEDGEVFMEFDRKLIKYAHKRWASKSMRSSTQLSPKFTVFFRVKYYVENVNQLRLGQTRHLYYLQLRKDILEAKTYCHEQSALKLAAYSLQAEKGDRESTDRDAYFRVEDFLPLKVVSKLGRPVIQSILPGMHSELQGQSREAAELHYLREAQTLPEYGMVFYEVAKEKHGKIGSIWLGLSLRGIVIYNVHKGTKTPSSHLAWKKIRNLSFVNRRFLIEVDANKILCFYTDSYKKAQYLLHLSINYHRFQLLPRELSEDNMCTNEPFYLPITAAIIELQDKSATLPIKFKLTGYQKKKDNNEHVYSPSYYIYPNGYYMAIKVFANGEKKDGAHPSGKNDLEELKTDSAKVDHQKLNALSTKDELQGQNFNGNEELPEGTAFSVELKKDRGMIGLRLAGGRNKAIGRGFIYVKSLSEGSKAAHNGEIKEKDILLEVNHKSVCGMTHREAAALILSSDSSMSLHVHRTCNLQWLYNKSPETSQVQNMSKDESWSDLMNASGDIETVQLHTISEEQMTVD